MLNDYSKFQDAGFMHGSFTFIYVLLCWFIRVFFFFFFQFHRVLLTMLTLLQELSLIGTMFTCIKHVVFSVSFCFLLHFVLLLKILEKAICWLFGDNWHYLRVPDGRRSLVFVVFIGGVTFAEIAALRFLSSQVCDMTLVLY